MRLLHDDELPEIPDSGEAEMTAKLGEAGLRAIDETLCGCAKTSWLKVARVVADALDAGGFHSFGDAPVDLHVRRIIELAHAGAIESRGNLRKPRWSEVRLPTNASARHSAATPVGPATAALEKAHLVQAAIDGDLELVRQLVEGGSDVNATDQYGWLPLHRAAVNNRDQVIAYLARAGSALEARGTDDWTPLHLACVSGSSRAVAALIKAGGDVNSVARDGNTPIHLALTPLLDKQCGDLHDESVRNVRSIVELLLRAGANPAAENGRGRTAAQIASAKDAHELARFLAKR
jgi:hypothetical protein